MKSLAQKLLATGLLFILSAFFLMPLIGWIGVSIVTDHLKGQAVSFLEYDSACMMVECGTVGLLILVGACAVFASMVLSGVEKFRNRHAAS